MTYRVARPIAAFATTLCCFALGPVAVASASGKSIKAVIVSYRGKIDIAEGHVVTAVGQYEQSSNPKDPAAVQAAIGESVAVLSSLEAKVAHQSARAPRVKKAKAKVEKGLEEIIVGYRDLSRAFGEKATNQEAAETDAKKAVVLAERGRKKLTEGAKLLG